MPDLTRLGWLELCGLMRLAEENAPSFGRAGKFTAVRSGAADLLAKDPAAAGRPQLRDLSLEDTCILG